MKITICGSMSFASRMASTKKNLEGKGHQVYLPCDIDQHLADPDMIDNLKADLSHMIENDVIRDHFNSFLT